MKEIFITSYLMGGLGNQMFQISKALSESYKNNLPSYFRLTSFIPMEGKQPVNYKDNVFRNINFDNNKIPKKRVNELMWNFYKTNHTYDESTEYFGYFQSSKNFLIYNNKIRNNFLPTDKFKEKIKNLYPNVFNKNSVSIHIRRGDYLSIPNVLPVIDKSYIDESLKRIGNYSNIFIFSNDKNWAKDNLNYENSIIIDDLEDYEELWMISLCNHNIMSNSSFSWWGSYLNINDNKKVFVPSVWFGPNGEKNYEDIYENDWTKIDVVFDKGLLIHKKNI